jgi:hypothetical protein
LFAGKFAEDGIGWCELLLPGCAVDERYTGQRVKRPRCGAPSLYSLLVPAGNKRPALPSNLDSGVEPSNRVGDSNGGKDVAEHMRSDGARRAASAMPTSKATTPHPSSPCSIGSTRCMLATAHVVPWQCSRCSALLIAPIPGEGSREGKGDAPHLFAGKCAWYRPGRFALCPRGALCFQCLTSVTWQWVVVKGLCERSDMQIASGCKTPIQAISPGLVFGSAPLSSRKKNGRRK